MLSHLMIANVPCSPITYAAAGYIDLSLVVDTTIKSLTLRMCSDVQREYRKVGHSQVLRAIDLPRSQYLG